MGLPAFLVGPPARLETSDRPAYGVVRAINTASSRRQNGWLNAGTRVHDGARKAARAS